MKRSRRHRFPAASTRTRAKLGGDLAAGVGASVLGTAQAEAAVVTIDLGPSGFNVLGANAGVSSGGYKKVNNFPFSGGPSMYLYNGYGAGLFFGAGGFNAGPANAFGVAVYSGTAGANPRKFGSSAAVPEPSAIALTGLNALALGAGVIQRSRKARKESLASAV